MMIHLDDWSTVDASEDPYRAPELRGTSLVGVVTGHRRKADGTRVKTSEIVGACGKVIQTRSGSTYLLGNINPEFREYLREMRPDWDENNPVTMVKS